MPTLVTFYALSEEVSEIDGEPIANELVIAAELAQESVKNRKKITVLCSTQVQAEQFDEFIWQYPADKFIPHNLYGEGPDMGTPVEIIWQSAYQKMAKLRNRAMVINLSQTVIEQQQTIGHIVDFVPSDEKLKAQARERYKHYKIAGCQLEYKNA